MRSPRLISWLHKRKSRKGSMFEATGPLRGRSESSPPGLSQSSSQAAVSAVLGRPAASACLSSPLTATLQRSTMHTSQVGRLRLREVQSLSHPSFMQGRLRGRLEPRAAHLQAPAPLDSCVALFSWVRFPGGAEWKAWVCRKKPFQPVRVFSPTSSP